LDADGLTFACATVTEARAARKYGGRTVRIGVRARRGIPDGKLVSFGFAGGLHDGLECGDVLDATRVVDAEGNVVWEGGPLGVSGARQGTILAADTVVDDPAERRRLHDRTGADAVDMETGALARSGRLVGCVRAISDTPSRTLGPVARTLGPDGRLAMRGVAGALARPRRTGRALRDIRRALRRLGEAL
jgi:adenosylhomocysteine nucleosidase